MGYHSPYSTPDGTPLAPEVVEASTPWSDVLLEDLRTTIQFNPTIRLMRKYGYSAHKSRFRGWGKALWLGLFVVVAFSWAFLRRQDPRYHAEMKAIIDLPTLDGLQFIDANHPYIRVGSPRTCHPPRLTALQYVGRWLSTADETHKDGSFPGNRPENTCGKLLITRRSILRFRTQWKYDCSHLPPQQRATEPAEDERSQSDFSELALPALNQHLERSSHILDSQN